MIITWIIHPLKRHLSIHIQAYVKMIGIGFVIYNSKSFQAQSTKNKANHAKLPYVHCGRSRPFVYYLEDDMVDGEIELFRVTHFSKKKVG